MPLGSSFEDVLSAARAGADWAWTRIYEDLAPVVLGYLRGQRLPDPEDVLGELFLQVVRSLHQFDGDEDAFRSWVFTIAHHRMIDARRKLDRRPDTDGATTEELDTHLPPAREAEAGALERVGTEDLLALLGELTEDQREVLTLRLVAGMTHAEVAEVLGKRVNAVKQLQRRALAALEKRLSEAEA